MELGGIKGQSQNIEIITISTPVNPARGHRIPKVLSTNIW